MNQNKRAILFDLDGTLWDSTNQIVESWNDIRIQQGYDLVSHEKISSLLGQPMDVFARQMYPDQDFENASKMLEEYMENENRYLEVHGATLYPNLRKVLEELHKDYFLAIISNCQKGYIEAFLKAHQLADLFDDYESYGNTLCYKDENIRKVIKRNNISEALYVGDIEDDGISANKAGVPFILAEYGFGNSDTPYRIKSLTDLFDVIDEIFAKTDLQ